MKALLVFVLIAVGLANAQNYDSYCTNPSGIYAVPSPSDCETFILCTGTVGTLHDCNNGTWFDSTFLICRPKEVAKCDHIPVVSVPDWVLLLCNSLDIGQTVPAETCGNYYICVGSTAFELSCPNGQHYSRPYSSCMNPVDAGCKALNTMCLGQAPGFTFPGQTCEQYYKCNINTNIPELTSCGNGLYYNGASGICVAPALSGCVNPGATTPIPPTPSTTPSTSNSTTPSSPTPTPNYVPDWVLLLCSTLDVGQLVPAETCGNYYVCYGSTAFEMECSYGQHYSRAYSKCMNPVDAGCKSLDIMCIGQAPNFTFPGQTCEQYYKCNNSYMPELYSCQSGLYYNGANGTCVEPGLSGCVNPTPLPSTTTPNSPTNTTTTTTKTTTTSTTKTTTPSTTTTAAPCNYYNTGAFFPSPKCNFFLMCYNSVALEFQCDDGQYFDAAVSYCVDDVDGICVIG